MAENNNGLPPTKRRRINVLAGKTPLTLRNTNLHKHCEDAAPFVRFSESCKPYKDAFVFARVPNQRALNPCEFPTDYSSSAEECLGKPGVHVWIVFEDGSFAAARVFSVYEILSKHMDIYLRAGKRPVIAAGEVYVITNDEEVEIGVLYNFQSGTFMQEISEKFSNKYESMPYEEFYGSWMDELWKKAGASLVSSVEKSMIHHKIIPITEEVLKAYARGGVEFRSFPTLNDCKQYASYYTDSAEPRRRAIRDQYDLAAASMAKYGRPVKPFEEWLKERGQEKLFEKPADVPPLFRGGRRKSRRRPIQHTKTQRSKRRT